MAFVSMMFVFLVIICLILGAVFILGLILFVIGLIRSKRTKNKGKKSPTVQIVVGGTLAMIPIGLVLAVIGGLLMRNLQEELTPDKEYASVSEKWQDEFVSSEEMREEAMAELLTAAEAQDKERFRGVFSEEARMVAGYPSVYEPTPGRSITEADLRELFEKTRDMDDVVATIG